MLETYVMLKLRQGEVLKLIAGSFASTSPCADVRPDEIRAQGMQMAAMGSSLNCEPTNIGSSNPDFIEEDSLIWFLQSAFDLISFQVVMSAVLASA